MRHWDTISLAEHNEENNKRRNQNSDNILTLYTVNQSQVVMDITL